MRRFALLIAAAALFLVADFAARDYAEGRLAGKLEGDLALSSRPEVDIGGFPFLVEVAGGRFESLRVTAERLRARGTELSRLALDLQDVRFSLPRLLGATGGAVRVGGGYGTARLREDALNAAIARQGSDATIRLREGAAFLRTPQSSQPVHAELSLQAGSLLVEAPAAGRFVEVPLPRIAGDLEYESITIRGSAAELSFRVAPSVLELRRDR